MLERPILAESLFLNNLQKVGFTGPNSGKEKSWHYYWWWPQYFICFHILNKKISRPSTKMWRQAMVEILWIFILKFKAAGVPKIFSNFFFFFFFLSPQSPIMAENKSGGCDQRGSLLLLLVGQRYRHLNLGGQDYADNDYNEGPFPFMHSPRSTQNQHLNLFLTMVIIDDWQSTSA